MSTCGHNSVLSDAMGYKLKAIYTITYKLVDFQFLLVLSYSQKQTLDWPSNYPTYF